jgi:alkanesulfonate monooxygenase SsuD/methylene tetrahydromethanopterin reductase-like flavin-dependent oxidoreductase (luciferase family)
VKLDLLVPLAWPPRALVSPPARALASLERAEAQGYAGVWLAEATPWRNGIGPALPLATAWVAARSERVHIGVAGALLPSLHPLRFAEELAMLDALSGGRLRWAVGGSADAGTEDDVFREQLEIVLLALTGESFAYDGACFTIPELRCLPAAVQLPHPPLWIRATCTAALEGAARRGHPVWQDALTSIEELEASRRRWSELAGSGSSRVPASPLPLLRSVHVGETDAAARATAAPGLLALARAHGPAVRTARAAGTVPDAETQPEAFVAFACENLAIVGDASRCREQIAALQERLGPFDLIAWHDFGGLPAEAVARSQERLVEVIAGSGRLQEETVSRTPDDALPSTADR